ncbi:protein Shroom1 [Tachysurus ichikawai]
MLCSRTSAAADNYDDDDDDDDDEVSGSSTPHDRTIPPTAQHPALYSTGANVTEKKRQLMAHIEEQLKSLEGLCSTLRGEEMEVGLLGNSLEALVRERCSPAELERYTQFIEDLERVISLLLCLSARLARVENALSTVDENMDSEEKV